jgi:hypothetical protein
MSFSFGFSGDDIEEDPNEVVEQNQQEQGQSNAETGPSPIAARSHGLDELVGTYNQHFPILIKCLARIKMKHTMTISLLPTG